ATLARKPHDMSPVRRWSIIAFAALVAVCSYYLMPAELPGAEGPVAIPEAARRTICIFAVAVIFWATEVIPLYATSLCVIGMQVLFIAGRGGMGETFPAVDGSAVTDLPAAQVYFNPFASGIIILFMGGFLLSAAVTKHRLDRKIASRILKPFAKNPVTLIFSVMLITAFFSMWMSNTATAVMMLAIVAPIVRSMPEDDQFHRGVILAVPFGANIGGIGTPIGTPPNAVALAALRKQFPDLNLSFLDWMMMAVPLALILIVAAGVVLLLMFRPAKGMAMPQIEAAHEPISKQGWATLVVLTTAIVLWLSSGVLGLSSAAVALLAAAALTALGVLEKRDVDSIDWNVLLLMWGGLSLGVAMSETGLIDVIAQLPFAQFQGFLLAAVVVLLGVTMSTFMSNTATANVLVPMVIAIGIGGVGASGVAADGTGGGVAIQLAVLTALACSFAMAMPVSTPPNAIAFATGKIPAATLIRSGGLLSILCIATLLVGYQFVMPTFLKMVLGG
ncbi:MAG: DASS family sodium-coupled anion symporter, partial [Planctomycetota bacterium]